MPSIIVKLCSSDARAWSQNQPVWLNENGEVARPVTRQEQHAIGRALERTKNVMQSFRLELPLLDIAPQRRNGPEPRTSNSNIDPRRLQAAVGGKRPRIELLDCAFQIDFYGRRKEKRVVTVFASNLRYSTSREVLSARLLVDHGECVLHGRNGKAIGVLRDPLINSREPNTGRRVQFSRNPEDEQRRIAAQAEQERQGVSSVRHHRAPTQRIAHASVKSPDQCPNDCRGRRGSGEWALATGAIPPTENQHHPVCKFAPAWAETLAPIASRFVLYDLELSKVARAADPVEVSEADAVEQQLGIRQITVAGRLYAVLGAEEASIAAREARGEGPDDDDTDAGDESEDRQTEPAPALAGDGGEEAAGGDTEPEPSPEDDVTAVSVPATDPNDRSQWPLLDESNPSERNRRRAEVTAKDYLSRPVPPPPPQLSPAGRSA